MYRTLRDAFIQCDIKKLKEANKKLYKQMGLADFGDIAAEAEIAAAIRKFHKMLLDVPEQQAVMFATDEHFGSSTAFLVSVDKIRKWYNENKEILSEPVLSDAELAELSNEELEKKINRCSRIETIPFEFQDWEKFLGYYIAEPCVEKYGSESCLANILWQMTTPFGFDSVDEEDVAEWKNLCDEMGISLDKREFEKEAEEVFEAHMDKDVWQNTKHELLMMHYKTDTAQEQMMAAVAKDIARYGAITERREKT